MPTLAGPAAPSALSSFRLAAAPICRCSCNCSTAGSCSLLNLPRQESQQLLNCQCCSGWMHLGVHDMGVQVVVIPPNTLEAVIAYSHNRELKEKFERGCGRECANLCCSWAGGGGDHCCCWLCVCVFGVCWVGLMCCVLPSLSPSCCPPAAESCWRPATSDGTTLSTPRGWWSKHAHCHNYGILECHFIIVAAQVRISNSHVGCG